MKERLEAAGFEILFDLEDILGSEDWARRVADMIAAADHFVFVISPDSCQSRVCAVEINTAVELSKSILPVAFRETPMEVVPEAIGARQWILCTAESGAASCADELRTLFATSPDWLRRHTELTGRACDWQLARRRSALLRGSDLRRAEQWLATSDGKQPPPSALKMEFIENSRDWRRGRRAINVGLAFTATVSAIVGRARHRSRAPPVGGQRAGIDRRGLDGPRSNPGGARSTRSDRSRAHALRHGEPRGACLRTNRGLRDGGSRGRGAGIVFSPDGALVLTLAQDGIARLWPTTECGYDPLREIAVENGIEEALFTADSHHIVFIGAQGGAALWRIHGTQVGAPLAGDFEFAWLTREGDVVALRRDFTVELWGVGTALVRKAIYTSFAHRPGYGAIARAEFSPAAGQLLVETLGNVILAWTLGTTVDAKVLPGSGLLALSADGTSYARATFTEQLGREYRRFYDVRVRPVEDGQEDLREAEHDDLVDDGAFSPDSNYLVTGSRDSIVQVSDLREPFERSVLRLKRHTGQIRGIAASGDRFATFADDRIAVLSRFDAPDSPTFLRGHIGPVISASFSPDGTTVVTGSEDGVARLWNLGASAEPLSLTARGQVVTDAWFSPDDRFVVARSHSMSDTPLVTYLEAWMPESPAAAIQLNEPPLEVQAIARHPSEASIGLPGGRNRRQEYRTRLDTSTGRQSSRGQRLDLRIRLWHANEAGLVRTLGAATESIEAMGFSPDGRNLIVTSKDETVRIWRTDGADPPVGLRGHTSWVVDADFSRYSTRVVTVSYDGSARLWNVDGSNEEVVLRGATYTATFDAAGIRIVTGRGDGKVNVWSTDARRLGRLDSGGARSETCRV